ncbi:MAG: Crp/Fnr family transcriptional regulator [Acidobacteriia bacterium]|nr:Crp/Fnr family transcriptional regulator [Terriglobia bacterium]
MKTLTQPIPSIEKEPGKVPMGSLDPIETLRRVPFFAVLPPEELKSLSAHCVARRVKKDEMLIAEGDPCEGLFVVQSGAIKLYKMAENGREQILVIERAGSTVGDLPIFDGGNFPASAVAAEDSTLLYLPKREFLDLTRNNSAVAFAVIRTLAWRFRYLTSLVEELSLKEVSHRLARFLRDRAVALGVRTRRGIEFPLEETNQEIGAEIGTVRDLVSRNLRRFVDRGIIKMERRKVIILDMAELEAQIAGTKRASAG